ncbi:hypothetical protein I4F81_009942 [Pyropia yezoensis]|uniref:Uncharacterized protein n=1 Tax=Pyropia yezoensis TaxID=2788 RepID=A0ACC3CB25_PYRYE|nr:hypothetical protein I4F81_009942 [Neopyropia yezoensis]
MTATGRPAAGVPPAGKREGAAAAHPTRPPAAAAAAAPRSRGVGLEETLTALTAAGLSGVVAVPTTPDGDTAAATAAALSTRGPFGVVVASGGDGTVSAVAAGLLAYTGAWTGAAADAVMGKGDPTAAAAAAGGGVRNGDGRRAPPPLPRPRIPLAVLPRGTANALAAALCLPTSVQGVAAAAAAAAAVTSTGMVDVAAAQAAAAADTPTGNDGSGGGGGGGGGGGRHAPPTTVPGGVRALDVGTANGRPFLLLTGIGLEADVVNGARRSLKARLGTLAYVASSLSRGLSHTPWALTYSVTAADGTTAAGAVRAATAVTVANTAPWTSVMAAAEARPAVPSGQDDVTTAAAADGADADGGTAVCIGGGVPDDGALDATAFTASAGGAPATAAAVVGLGLAASAGAPPPKHVHTARVVALTVDASPPQRVVVDGEAAGTTPVAFG